MPIVLIIALVLFAGVASFWLAWRLRWPTVPLLLLCGAALSHVLPPLKWGVFSPIIGTAGVTLGIYVPLSSLAQSPLPRIAFAFSLVLLVRPLLAYLGARKAGLSRSENRLLRLTAPRGVLTLGITVHLTQLLHDAGNPEALSLIPIVSWSVLISILGPWLVPTLWPRFLSPGEQP